MTRPAPTNIQELQSKFSPTAARPSGEIPAELLALDPDRTIEVDGQRLNVPFEILKSLAGSLDNVSLTNDPTLPTSFEITLGETQNKEVYEGKVTDSQKVAKPTATIFIEINPNSFTFADIPDFVRKLTETHNDWIDQKYGTGEGQEPATEEQKKLWQMNIGLEFARKFIAVAQILEEALSLGEKPKGSILSSNSTEIESVKTLLEEIASDYGMDLGEFTIPIGHQQKEQIKAILKKERPQNGTKIGTKEEVEAKRLKAILKIVDRELSKSTTQSLDNSLFDRSATEVMRLTGMDELLQFYEPTAYEPTALQKITKYFKDLWSNLSGKEVQTKLSSLRSKLENATDPIKKPKYKGKSLNISTLFFTHTQKNIFLRNWVHTNLLALLKLDMSIVWQEAFCSTFCFKNISA